MTEIRINSTTSHTAVSRLALHRKGRQASPYNRFLYIFRRKSAKRRLTRFGLLGFYVLLLVGSILFVVYGSSSAGSAPTPPTVARSIGSPTNTTAPTSPLDQLSSVEIALQVAQLSHLPETTHVRNQADSDRAALAMMSASSDVAAKSLVVATTFKSNKDIQTYKVKSGDTISSIAAKFHITSDSVRWSNDLSGESVNAGEKLYIPPVDGIVYTVKSGDTIDSLAKKYDARKDQIVAYNDAELKGIHTGELILIPNGKIVAPAPVFGSYASTFVSSGFTPLYGNNGYDYGWCTWYVASRIKVPNNWGDAISWAYYARLSGWTVSSVPVVGAIAQTTAGWGGHVGIVEAVSPDGSQIKYSDMNGLAGWGKVGYSGWVPVSHFPNYIYH